MNVLKKNANFFIKNQQKIRFYFSVVRPKVIETSLSNESCQRIPIELNFCQKINRTKYNALKIQVHQFSSDCAVPQLHYEKFCAETLDSLCDYFEELVESVNELATADVLNKDGVLTVSLGSKYGTYVINKQSPNKQIWLSSPQSGPKRFDFVYGKDDDQNNGFWVYKHTGETLHELLDTEFSEIAQKRTEFQSLAFGSRC